MPLYWLWCSQSKGNVQLLQTCDAVYRCSLCAHDLGGDTVGETSVGIIGPGQCRSEHSM